MTKRFFAAHISRTVVLSAVVAAVLAVVPEANAQFDAEAADRRALQLYEEGEAAYTEGRYEVAVRSFTAAHRLSPRPLLLYNLANAYERLGRYGEAAQALEEYLPDAPIDERAVLQTRLENLRLRLSGGTPAVVEQAPSDGSANTGGAGDAAVEPASGGGLLVPGLALGAGGVALIAAGVVFGVQALDARASLQGSGAACGSTSGGRSLCTTTGQGLIADAELYALLADVGLIGGGVIAAVGLVLTIVGATSGPETPPAGQVSWAPDVRVGTSGFSLGARGRF